MFDINALFTIMVKEGASDLFLKVGAPPSMRVVGKVIITETPPLTEQDMKDAFEKVASETAKKRFLDNNEADISYEVGGTGRFRGNIFRQRGYIGMVFRAIKSSIPSFEDLNLPVEQLKKLSMIPRGLVLITGTTGSGKSTTLAAMINYINDNAEKHIVTVEDPIEFTFRDRRSVIEQREIGQDTESFSMALKHVVRQSPDVIMIGEMRDKETCEAALNAAETGHLVFSTLHTLNAMQTVERIMNLFPPYQHDFLKGQLAQILEGVVSMRLLTTVDNDARVPAMELMLATPTIRELLQVGKTRELYKAIKEGSYYGTQTFNQALRDLLNKGLISLEDALNAADSPDELKLELRGISKDTTRFATNERDAARINKKP